MSSRVTIVRHTRTLDGHGDLRATRNRGQSHGGLDRKTAYL
jgi:hypothetical protein